MKMHPKVLDFSMEFALFCLPASFRAQTRARKEPAKSRPFPFREQRGETTSDKLRRSQNHYQMNIDFPIETSGEAGLAAIAFAREKEMPSNEDERKIAKKLREWIATPEGRERIEEAKRKTMSLIEDLREAQIIDPKVLNEPITL